MLPAILVLVGGVFVLLMGIATATPDAPLSYLSVYAGPVGLVAGGLLVALPAWRRALGALAVVLAVVSVPYSYGGLFVGAFCLGLGGVLAYVWVPPPPGRTVEASPRGRFGRS